MDRNQRAAHLIKELNLYKVMPERRGNFVKLVCDYFDAIKSEKLGSSDLNFLRYVANEAGIPHYYELLENKFQIGNAIDTESMNLLSISSFLNESNLMINNQMLHKYQKEVLDKFDINDSNRYVLSAPTSFGKTFTVYEIIKKMKYVNVLLIFPTISLLSENFLKLQNDEFFSSYNIHTLSEVSNEAMGEKNVFIYTPERYLSFLDNNEKYFDFAFVDEIYKIDNDFIINNDTPEENERDTAYRFGLEFACRNSRDLLLVGPYIQFKNIQTEENSFNNFTLKNSFNILEYNDVEIVSKHMAQVRGNKLKIGNDEYRLNTRTSSLQEKVSQTIVKLSGNSLIYCARKQDVGRFAKFLLNDESYNSFYREKETNSEIYSIFLEHVGNIFGEDWILYKALAKRIGIHHAGIPKYIQNEIINLFNMGELLCLFSTTTITEGVNTTAKNIIITAVKKGSKDLKQFDAKNIAGRAGRFYSHYSGNVIDLTQKFEGLIESRQDEIEHKNYDKSRGKTDVDLEVTRDEFLSDSDKNRKIEINKAKLESGLPEFIFQSYKTISPLDKISIYKRIERMTTTELQRINQLKQVLNSSNGSRIHWEGFQTVVDICSPFVYNDELKRIMDTRVGNKSYSLIVIQTSGYLSNGFLGTVDYYVNEQKKTKDLAISQTARLIYTTFKYYLVKYLGVFDLLYRYQISKIYKRKFEDVSGIQILLQRLEYNALTESGRKLSDYGVPFALVKYYDENHNQKQFDEYEMYIDSQVQNLLN